MHAFSGTVQMPQLRSQRLLSKMSLDWQLSTPMESMSAHELKECMASRRSMQLFSTHGGGGGGVLMGHSVVDPSAKSSIQGGECTSVVSMCW